MNMRQKKDICKLKYMDEDILLEIWLEHMREQEYATGGYWICIWKLLLVLGFVLFAGNIRTMLVIFHISIIIECFFVIDVDIMIKNLIGGILNISLRGCSRWNNKTNLYQIYMNTTAKSANKYSIWICPCFSIGNLVM